MRSVRLIALFFVACASFLNVAEGQANFEGKSRAQAIAPFLDEQTIGVVHLDLSRADVDRLLRELQALAPGAEDALAGLTDFRPLAEQLVRSGASDVYLIVSLYDLPRAPFIAVRIAAGADPETLQSLLAELRLEIVERVGDLFFAGSKRSLERIKSHAPAKRPELDRAFSAAGNSAVQVLLLPTADHRRVVEELLPTLPPEAGGGPSRIVTRGAMWAALALDWEPHPGAILTVQSQDREAAVGLRDKWQSTIRLLANDARIVHSIPQLKDLADQLVPTVNGDRLQLKLDGRSAKGQAMSELLRTVLIAAQGPARESRAVSNLKQIGLAMHNFHDTYGSFPPAASYSADGKPLLSWRVHLLPYLDQAALYQQFRLDEPWDSDHNRKLTEQMPALYRSASWSREEPDKTCFVVVTSTGSVAASRKAAVAADAKQDRPQPATAFQGREGVQVADITDGTSNTIMALEAEPKHAVVWTKPDDLAFDPERPAIGFGADSGGRVVTLFCDGSVRLLDRSLDSEKWRRLLLRNDGEPVDAN